MSVTEVIQKYIYVRYFEGVLYNTVLDHKHTAVNDILTSSQGI